MNWDDFISDLEQIGETVDNFFENHCKTLLVLLLVLMVGMVAGWGFARLENPADEQAEVHAEVSGGEDARHEQH